MGTMIGWLAAKQLFGRAIGEKAARALLTAGLFVAALLLCWGAIAAYNRSVIAHHEAKQDAATAKADRKADGHAADQRLTDAARTTHEKQQTQEAIDEARRNGTDPRAAYYECVRREQAARNARQPSPDC